MRKFFMVLLILNFLDSSGQQNEKVIADTIAFVTESINKLEGTKFQFECYRLNFDDCNLECEETTTEEGRWTISSFFLPDLDEEKMKLLQQPGGEWTLILFSESMKIKYDEEDGSGLKEHVLLWSEKPEPLLEIGKALYFAIKSCKGLDRFKK